MYAASSPVAPIWCQLTIIWARRVEQEDMEIEGATKVCGCRVKRDDSWGGREERGREMCPGAAIVLNSTHTPKSVFNPLLSAHDWTSHTTQFYVHHWIYEKQCREGWRKLIYQCWGSSKPCIIKTWPQARVVLTSDTVRKEITVIIKVNFMNKSSNTDQKAASAVSESLVIQPLLSFITEHSSQGLADWREMFLDQTHNHLGTAPWFLPGSNYYAILFDIPHIWCQQLMSWKNPETKDSVAQNDN